jgi:hypothetical protein
MKTGMVILCCVLCVIATLGGTVGFMQYQNTKYPIIKVVTETKEIQMPPQIIFVNQTQTNTEYLPMPCPVCIPCDDDKKSAYNIYGGWATNNTWWKNQTCTTGYNCSKMG